MGSLRIFYVTFCGVGVHRHSHEKANDHFVIHNATHSRFGVGAV